MAIVISDTSPIRAFSNLGLVDVLGKLFGEVYVPIVVAKELLHPKRGVPVDVAQLAFVRVRVPSDFQLVDTLRQTLDWGEAEAIALALEVNGSLLLMDELKGRAEANRRGIRAQGVLGILAAAKQRGYISKVAPIVGMLRRKHDFFLSDAVVQQALRAVGEELEPGK